MKASAVMPSAAKVSAERARAATVAAEMDPVAMARAVMAALYEIDVRQVLPTIRVPTLILHRTGDLVAPVEGARLMAERIPDARMVEFEGTDHVPFTGDFDPVVGVERNLRDSRHIRLALRTAIGPDLPTPRRVGMQRTIRARMGFALRLRLGLTVRLHRL